MQRKLMGNISVDFDATGQQTMDNIFCIRQILGEKKKRIQ
jgi:predicted membrane protein